MSRTAAARRITAALAAVVALGGLALPAVSVAAQEAADRLADPLAGRWSGTWTDFSDGSPVPISVAIDTFGDATAEATITYRLLSGRALERRLPGSRTGSSARFDMGDGQYLVCRPDPSGRLRVRIVNPRSTTRLLLERDSVAAPVLPDLPPAAPAAPRATDIASQPPAEPAAANTAAANTGAGLGVWSGRWYEPGAPPGPGRGPLRVEVDDAGDGMRRVRVSGVAGVTGPAVVSERQLRGEGLVVPVGAGRDLILVRGPGGGLRLRLLLPDTVLMALLTKDAPVAETARAARTARAMTAAPTVAAAPSGNASPEAPPGPRVVADLAGLDLPLRPDLVLPGPVAADDPRAEAYAGSGSDGGTTAEARPS